MENNRQYAAPAILEDVDLELGCQILAQSVVTKDDEVESTGQQIEDHTMQSGYEHNWE